MDDNEKSCKEDCKELPYPDECKNEKAKKTCEKLKNKQGPMKVTFTENNTREWLSQKHRASQRL